MKLTKQILMRQGSFEMSLTNNNFKTLHTLSCPSSDNTAGSLWCLDSLAAGTSSELKYFQDENIFKIYNTAFNNLSYLDDMTVCLSSTSELSSPLSVSLVALTRLFLKAFSYLSLQRDLVGNLFHLWHHILDFFSFGIL